MVFQISPMDCTGCGMCMYACPVKGTLTMVPIEEELRQQVLWNFVEKLPPKPNQSALSTLKGSQLKRPLFEFSGACSGCGEAAYMKLLTQLFGERMSIIITAGCSSAVAVSFGSCPYTKTELGWGPNIQTSLFESAISNYFIKLMIVDCAGNVMSISFVNPGRIWPWECKRARCFTCQVSVEGA